MTWVLDADGAYVLLAEGRNAKGERCTEKAQRLRPDGVAYPVEGLPGLTSVTTRPFAPKPRERMVRSLAKAPTWLPPMAER